MTLMELADRLDEFNAKMERISKRSESGELTPAGTSNAVALLATMNAGLFYKAAASLRARAQ
jgi:hypothetical protein